MIMIIIFHHFIHYQSIDSKKIILDFDYISLELANQKKNIIELELELELEFIEGLTSRRPLRFGSLGIIIENNLELSYSSL